MSLNVTLNVNGCKFNASARQASTIQTLIESQKGGFAKVRGYTSTSGRIKPETSDYTVLTRFSVEKMYQRKIAALKALTLGEIATEVAKHPKLAELSVAKLQEEFENRRMKELESLEKTLDGDRDDAHRAAHDRNYCTIATGVKVHFVTEERKDADGKKIRMPVLDSDGIPTVESIMLGAITIAKNVLIEGEYKPVNSGVPVLLSKIFEKLSPKSTKYIALSLKEDNFDSLTIDGETILPKDIAGDFT